MNITRFCQARSANIAIITALAIMPLMGLFGLGIDTGTWAQQRSKVQQAADAAAGAGTVFLHEQRQASPNPGSFDYNAHTNATQIVSQNVLTTNTTGIDCDLTGTDVRVTNGVVRVEVSCTYTPIIMSLFQVQSQTYTVIATADVIAFDSLDLLFILDMSGSMCPQTPDPDDDDADRDCSGRTAGGKIEGLRAAMHIIADYIDPDDDDDPNLKDDLGIATVRAGILPYGTAIDMGDDFAQSYDDPSPPPDRRLYSIEPTCLSEGGTSNWGGIPYVQCTKWEISEHPMPVATNIRAATDNSNLTLHLTEVGHEDGEKYEHIVAGMADFREVIDTIRPRVFDLKPYTPWIENDNSGTGSENALHIGTSLLLGDYDGFLPDASQSDRFTENVEDPNDLKVIVFMTDGKASYQYFDRKKYAAGGGHEPTRTMWADHARGVCAQFRNASSKGDDEGGSQQFLIITAFYGVPGFQNKQYLNECSTGDPDDDKHTIEGSGYDFIEKFSEFFEFIIPYLDLS